MRGHPPALLICPSLTHILHQRSNSIEGRVPTRLPRGLTFLDLRCAHMPDRQWRCFACHMVFGCLQLPHADLILPCCCCSSNNLMGGVPDGDWLPPQVCLLHNAWSQLCTAPLPKAAPVLHHPVLF